MLSTLLVCLLGLAASAFSEHTVVDPPDKELEVIISELDIVLDCFYFLLDEQDLDVFITGVRHAARARLLLEQYLGEGVNDLARETNGDDGTYHLKLIAKRVEDLSGWAGREIWRQDFDDKQRAILRLSEMEEMVKSLKKSL